MTTFINDLANMAQGDYSVRPGSTAVGNTDAQGGWVDLSDTIGAVHGIAGISGLPGETFVATVKLQEADDNSGTNATDMTGASATGSTNDGSVLVSSGKRSKPFVRMVIDFVISAGSSAGSTANISGYVFGQKQRL